MGFIEKLSSLFTAQKVPAEEVEVPVSELYNFFSDKVDEKFDTIRPQIQFRFEKIFSERRAIEEDLVKLSEAQFANDKIEEKAKQVALGNRDEFIKKVHQFLEQLSVPSTLSYTEVHAFCTQFSERYEQFNAQITKQFEILRQFFSDQVMSLGKHLDNIRVQEDMIQLLLSKHNLSPEDYSEMSQLITSYLDLIKQRDECLKEIEENKQEVEATRKSKEAVKQRIDELKQSSNYVELLDIQNEMANLKSMRKEIKQELEAAIHGVEKILKKYDYANPGDLFLSRYLKDPLQALEEDTTLQFKETLGKVKQALDSGQIEVNENLQQKFTEFYQDYANQKLDEFQTRLSVIADKLGILNKKEKLINIGHELNDLSYKHSHLDSKLTSLNSKLQKVNELYHSININDIEKKIKAVFLETFNYSLTIVNS
jgi:DNA repair exonuclease SbcCD ATPase subunit